MTHLQPDHVVLVPLEATPTQTLWPRPQKTRQRPRRAATEEQQAVPVPPREDEGDGAEQDAVSDEVSGQEEEEEEVTDNSDLLEQAAAMNYLFASDTTATRSRKRPRSEEEDTGGAVAVSDQPLLEPGAASSSSVPFAGEAVATALPEDNTQAAGDAGMAVAVAAAEADVDAAPGPRRGGPRGGVTEALATSYVTGGRISYYLSKDAFEAVCYKHTNCNLSRTAKTKRGGRGGRPCGLLATWLADDSAHSKAEHKAPERLRGYTLAQRREKRAALAATPSGQALLAHERPKASGELSEPEELLGYL